MAEGPGGPGFVLGSTLPLALMHAHTNDRIQRLHLARRRRRRHRHERSPSFLRRQPDYNEPHMDYKGDQALDRFGRGSKDLCGKDMAGIKYYLLFLTKFILHQQWGGYLGENPYEGCMCGWCWNGAGAKATGASRSMVYMGNYDVWAYNGTRPQWNPDGA